MNNLYNPQGQFLQAWVVQVNADGSAVNPVSLATFGQAFPSAGIAMGAYNATTGFLTKLSVDDNGNLKVIGIGAAQSSAIAGATLSPVGYETLSATPTRTTAQVDIPVLDLAGRTTISFGLRDQAVTASVNTQVNTIVDLLAAAGASTFYELCGIQITNSHVTQFAKLTVTEETSGTVLGIFPCPPLSGGSFTFRDKYQPTANKKIQMTASAAANIDVTIDARKVK